MKELDEFAELLDAVNASPEMKNFIEPRPPPKQIDVSEALAKLHQRLDELSSQTA